MRLVPVDEAGIADVPLDAAAMIELPQRAGFELDARGAQEPRRFEAAEGRWIIAAAA